MKNLNDKKFKVVLVEDYSDNYGDPDTSSTFYNTLEEATVAFNEELAIEYFENGKTCRIELWDLTEDEDGLEISDEPLKEGYMVSALLPKDGVVVTFKHHTYMNYCYAITGVRKVYEDERYENLNVSVDHIYTNWDTVYDSLEEFQEAYENGYSSPMDKINSGSSHIKEFLAENNVEDYN